MHSSEAPKFDSINSWKELLDITGSFPEDIQRYFLFWMQSSIDLASVGIYSKQGIMEGHDRNQRVLAMESLMKAYAQFAAGLTKLGYSALDVEHALSLALPILMSHVGFDIPDVKVRREKYEGATQEGAAPMATTAEEIRQRIARLNE